MARMGRWSGPEPVTSVWPPDRFEVRCTFPPPDFTSSDRFHYPEFAYELARRLREGGYARQIQVIRLSDGAVLFDLMSAREVPVANW